MYIFLFIYYEYCNIVKPLKSDDIEGYGLFLAGCVSQFKKRFENRIFTDVRIGFESKHTSSRNFIDE